MNRQVVNPEEANRITEFRKLSPHALRASLQRIYDRVTTPPHKLDAKDYALLVQYLEHACEISAEQLRLIESIREEVETRDYDPLQKKTLLWSLAAWEHESNTVTRNRRFQDIIKRTLDKPPQAPPVRDGEMAVTLPGESEPYRLDRWSSEDAKPAK